MSLPNHSLLAQHLLSRHYPSTYALHTLDGNMVARVCSSLVKEAHWFPAQRHKLAFEANVSHLSNLFLPVTPVILEE